MLFDRWRQGVLPQGHIGATWRIRLTSCILRPTRVHNRSGDWTGLAVLHSLRQKVPILYNGRPYPPKLPLRMEDLDLPIPCNMWCFPPIPLPSNRHHRSNGDCLEGKGELSGLFCTILCATTVHSVMRTHMNRPNSSLDWVLSHGAHFTVLRFIFVWCITVCCMQA